MHALRRSRNFGRLFAAWLLLWFLAMTARPILALPDLREACALVPIEQAADDAAHAAHADHGDGEHHAGHELADAACDAATADAHSAHADHASGSAQHCPVCMHAAAPPGPQFAHAPEGAAPAEATPVEPRAPLRSRTDVPPPARGPPLSS
jgi:hypothetical protein